MRSVSKRSHNPSAGKHGHPRISNRIPRITDTYKGEQPTLFLSNIIPSIASTVTSIEKSLEVIFCNVPDFPEYRYRWRYVNKSASAELINRIGRRSSLGQHSRTNPACHASDPASRLQGFYFLAYLFAESCCYSR